MASSSLTDFLAGDALTKVAKAYATKPGVGRPFPAAYYQSQQNPNAGTIFSYDYETGSREQALVVNADSPSKPAQGVSTINKKVTAIGSRESYTVPLEMIAALQQPAGIIQMNARAELSRQIGNFVVRFQTLRSNSLHSMMLRGKIDVASTGLLQTSTSSPIRTIDASIPTANNLTTDGSGGTLNIGDWSSASTDIPGKVLGLKRTAAKSYGFGVGVAYYGVNVPGYLAKNTLFKEYLSRNPGFNQAYKDSGEIPDGVLGLKWVNVSTATFVSSGTATSWASDNYLGFSPELDSSWFQNIECGLPCPTGLVSEGALQQAMLSAEGLAAAFPVQYGMHAYTVMNTDPIQAKVIVADFHVPMITAPNAFYMGVCG